MNQDIIKKLAIIGNGFDMAHGLRTSYKDFADKYCDNEVVKQFHQYVDILDAENPFVDEAGVTRYITWYSFELNIERLIVWRYQKDMTEFENSVELAKLNDLFSKLEGLLGEFILEEYCSKDISPMASVREWFDDYSLAISFNYTDTVKMYTDRYYYVHGSLSDDNHIIIGLANGVLPCLCNGDFISFHKDVRKEELSFLRFLNENGCSDKVGELEDFKEQALSLHGSRGEYALSCEDGENDISDENGSSFLIDYARKNGYKAAKEPFDYTYVEEIAVLGHGLESDVSYLTGIFEETFNLRRIILYIYDKESEDEIERKVSVLKDMSGLSDIEIVRY